MGTMGLPNPSGATAKLQPIGAVPTTGSATAGTQLPQIVATASANPFAAATQPGATVPQTNGINWNDGSKTVTGDFKDTYGAGTGTAISQVLQGMGTTTSNAIQATLSNVDLQAGKQAANISSGLAASGVTADSSTNALAMGDFYSGVNAQEQQTISGMEENEEQTLLQTLLGEGGAHGTDGSTLDSIMNGIGDVGSIASGITGLIPGLGGL